MDQDRLDKFIKKQVEELKTPTDTDLLWQKIQAKKAEEEKPKRRFFFFWLLGGALLLSGLAVFYVIGFSNTNDDLSNDIPRQKEYSVNDQVAINHAPKDQIIEKNIENIDSSTDHFSEQISPSVNLNSNNEKIKDSTQSPVMKSADSEEAIPTTKIRKSIKSVKERILKPSPQPTGYPDFNDSNINQNKKNAQTLDKTNSETKEKTEETLNLGNGKTRIDIPSTLIDSTGLYAAKEAIKTNKEISKNLTNDSLVTITENKSTAFVDTSFASNKPMIAPNFVDTLKEQTGTALTKEADQDKKKKWTLSNGASFVYGRGLRSLSSQNSAPENYIQRRKDSESTLDAVRARIDFRLENRNGFYLQSGLEYEQINEQFDFYNETDIVAEVNDQLLAIIYAMDGSTSELIGSKEVELTSWLRKKTFNHYNRIDIPILLGYHSTKKEKRLGWFVETGISMNVRFKAKGEILNVDDEILSLEQTTLDEELFKKRTGISLLGAAGLTFRITNRITLSASPEVKYNLKSISNNNQAFNQKYVNVGIGVGMRYHWL